MINPRLEELRGKFHENPRRYFAPYANELRKAGDTAQAIAVCRTHLATQPGHVSGHIVLGQALYEAGETGEARDVFTAALELDPENLIALRSLGEIAQVNGEFNAARQWYQRLLDADPRNTEVAQLLRDIPTEAKPKPIEAAPALEEVEEPTPFTIREEVAAAEVKSEPAPPPPPAPSFHTSFTGSGPAYKSADELAEEEKAKSLETPASEDSAAFVDLQPTAHETGARYSSEWQKPSTEAESLDMVDLGEQEEAAVVEAAHETSPDESFEFSEAMSPEAEPSAGYVPESQFDSEMHDEEMPFEPDALPVASADFEVDQPPTASAGDDSIALEIEDFAGDALNPQAPSQPDAAVAEEPPRAVFAERGFDGRADDEMGWMTTPSAALSDLEAAPEDWFEGTEEKHAEQDETPPVAEAAPDPASDSWFDEVPGATSVEPTEVTTDELWLPPELPQVPSVEATAPVGESVGGTVDASPEPEAWAAAAREEPAVAETPNEEERWSSPVSAEASYEEPQPLAAEAEAQQPAALHESAQSWTDVSYPDVSTPDEETPTTAFEAESKTEPVLSAIDMDAADVGQAGVIAEQEQDAPAPHAWSESAPMVAEAPDFEDHQIIEVPQDLYAGAGSDAPVQNSEPIGHTPDDIVATPTPAPFITETLAELYLQQGFRDEALSIYRQLLERAPGDEALKARIAAIEEHDTPAPARLSAETRAASQSVRTFFSRLAKRPAAVIGRTADTSGPTGSGGDPDAPFNVAASALANLFTASKPQPTDENAASSLAGAFSDPGGRPSRAAERELSLDHLFRDVPPGGQPGGSVTLDEFYSTPGGATGSSTESESEPGPEDAGGTDIRQFTAWLEGLRKK